MVQDNQKEEEIIISTMMTEVNMVGSNQKEWYVDIVVIWHICSYKELFTTIEATTGKKVWMGNSAQSTVNGMGKVLLKMTSRKKLTLNNVL